MGLQNIVQAYLTGRETGNLSLYYWRHDASPTDHPFPLFFEQMELRVLKEEERIEDHGSRAEVAAFYTGVFARPVLFVECLYYALSADKRHHSTSEELLSKGI